MAISRFVFYAKSEEKLKIQTTPHSRSLMNLSTSNWNELGEEIALRQTGW